MKTLLLFFAAALLCAPAAGQGVLYTANAQTLGQVNGTAVVVPQGLAEVTVCLNIGASCVGATVYADSSLTQPLAQPFLADSLGNITFWASPGNYQYTVCPQTNDACATFSIGGGSGTSAAATLTVSQMLTAKGINGTFYTDPTSTADLVTQINALGAACSWACEVHIVAGTYTVASGTVTNTNPAFTLSGDGPNKVIINYAGTKFIDYHPVTSYTFTASHKIISGFTLFASNAAVNPISWGNVIGASIEDVNIYGPGGITSAAAAGTSECLKFQNTHNWTERWTLHNVQLGGCQTNIHFYAPSGDGTSSYGYGIVESVFTNQGLGSKGVVVDAGAQVYNQLDWHYQFNLAGSGPGSGNPVVFDIEGVLRMDHVSISGENYSQPYTLAHLGCGGYMQGNGAIYVFGNPVVISDCAAGAGEVIPRYYIGPSFGRGTVLGSAGAPTLTNYPTTGNTDVYSIAVSEFGNTEGNNAAIRGTLTRQSDGLSAPFDAFANGLQYCINTYNPYATLANLSPIWCVDSAGQVNNRSVINFLGSVQEIRGNGLAARAASAPIAAGSSPAQYQNIFQMFSFYGLDAFDFSQYGYLTMAGGLKTGHSANTDMAGQLTLSGGVATYSFAGTYASSPSCTASDATAVAAVKVTATNTVLTVQGTGTDLVNYICVGRN